MGLLAFLYRMMAVHEYTIAEVNALEVWECAVALGVDTKFQPMTSAAESERTPRRVVDDAMMMTPTQEIDFDPTEMLNRVAFAQVES